MELSVSNRARYFSQRAAWFVAGTVFGTVVGRFAKTKQQRPDRATLLALRRRLKALLEADLRNAQDGHYPLDLLLTSSVTRRVLNTLPRLIRDAPRFAARKRKGNFKDLPRDVELTAFPAYYRRNFHWQSGGYLSKESAAVYETSVELLFRGTADVMRRQVIPHLKAQPLERILDVGTGTGAMLAILARCFDDAQLEGLDLSPFYAAEAQRRLGNRARVTAGNAEHLTAADNTYDAVTSVYMFHELPRKARRAVVREAYRVLRPGGLLVIEDSSQYADAPELRTALEAFPREFHEPYYLDYLGDSLPDLVREAGFTVVAHESHMVSAVVAARK